MQQQAKQEVKERQLTEEGKHFKDTLSEGTSEKLFELLRSGKETIFLYCQNTIVPQS